MASNDYHFITHWRVPGTVKEVYDVIGDAADLPRWWPSVYLAVGVLDPGDPATGLGKVVDLYTKGWLPYTLRWQFRVTEVSETGYSLDAWGDFDGRGVWTFAQDGPWVDMTYDWAIRADKPLLRYLSFIFKPIFAANHRWAMARGEESLVLELARRSAATPAERAAVAPPPGPTALPTRPLLAGAAATALLFLGMRRLVRR